MRYTYLAVFCALWTLASSLPLTRIAPNVQETNYRSLSRRTIPHAVSLKKSDVGADKEHWAVHVHPVQAGRSDLHVLHAVADPEKGGVLQVEHLNKGTYTGPSTNPTSKTVHLGNVPTKGKALEAVKGVKNNVELNQPFPKQNCVDFSCKAVHHMVDHHGLDPSAATVMDKHYKAEAAGVRQRTGTDDNKAAAGVPK